MTFEQRLDGSRGKNVVSRGNTQCKDLSVGSLARCAGGAIREQGDQGKVSEGDRGRKIVKIVK